MENKDPMSTQNDNEIDASDNSNSQVELTQQKEIGGPEGPEPTRYGDWEKNGRCSDF